MNDGITIWVYKINGSRYGGDHAVIASSISPDDLEATGLSYEDFYRRFQTMFPSSEGFKVKCSAERKETIELDFDGALRLEEPIIVEHNNNVNQEFLGY